jgi:hypothetical protein
MDMRHRTLCLQIWAWGTRIVVAVVAVVTVAAVAAVAVVAVETEMEVVQRRWAWAASRGGSAESESLGLRWAHLSHGSY